jgi:phosphoribosylaminoimidazole (AIR) synthetase
LHKRWICKATKRRDCDDDNLEGPRLGAYLILLLRKEYDSGDGLIEGETAKMPSMYSPGEYDLAGFAVGAVHWNHILLQSIEVGDILLPSQRSREHSNGFSLVRKLLEKKRLFCNHAFPWHSSSASICDALLTPTKIYLKSCLPTSFKDIISQGYGNLELIDIFSSFTTC